MQLLIWIIMGLLISIVAIMFAPRSSSVLGTLLLGVLGSVLGALLATVIFNLERFNINPPTLAAGIFLSLTLVVVQRAIVKS